MGPWKTPKTRKITFPPRPVQTTVSGKMMPFLVLEPTLSQTEPLCLQIPDLLSLFPSASKQNALLNVLGSPGPGRPYPIEH